MKKMNKKIIAFIITIITIVIFTINVTCASETLEEYLERNENANIYKVVYSNGEVEYFASYRPIEFELKDYIYKNGNKTYLNSGYVLEVKRYNTWSIDRYIVKTGKSQIYQYSDITIVLDEENLIGHDWFEIYQKDGDSFFLLKDLGKEPLSQMILTTMMSRILPLTLPIVGLIVFVVSFRKGWGFLRRQLIIS